MTKSTTTLSSDRDGIEATLHDFLAGEVSVAQLQDALRNCMTIHFSSIDGRREIRDNTLEGVITIPVDAQDVRRRIEQFLTERISSTDLSDWAAFIILSEIFVPSGDTDEERWQAGDGPVWDILQRLMTPAVFDGLDSHVAERYLAIAILREL